MVIVARERARSMSRSRWSRDSAMQPSVGFMPVPATCMKIALPRPLTRGGLVVAEDDDDIVETILPPEVLGARRIGMAHAPIVVAVRGIVAPAVAPTERGDRQPRPRPHARRSAR